MQCSLRSGIRTEQNDLAKRTEKSPSWIFSNVREERFARRKLMFISTLSVRTEFQFDWQCCDIRIKLSLYANKICFLFHSSNNTFRALNSILAESNNKESNSNLIYPLPTHSHLFSKAFIIWIQTKSL